VAASTTEFSEGGVKITRLMSKPIGGDREMDVKDPDPDVDADAVAYADVEEEECQRSYDGRLT
jgi:hypothetical protein